MKSNCTGVDHTGDTPKGGHVGGRAYEDLMSLSPTLVLRSSQSHHSFVLSPCLLATASTLWFYIALRWCHVGLFLGIFTAAPGTLNVLNPLFDLFSFSMAASPKFLSCFLWEIIFKVPSLELRDSFLSMIIIAWYCSCQLTTDHHCLCVGVSLIKL